LLERGISTDIVGALKKLGVVPTNRQLNKIGEVKNFGQLVPASQRQGSPLFETGAGTPTQRHDAKSVFKNIAQKIISRTR
jgi:hypothetical protein